MRPVEPQQSMPVDDYPVPMSRGRSDDLVDRDSQCMDLFDILHAPLMFGSHRSSSGLSDVHWQELPSGERDQEYLDETPGWWQANERADKKMPGTDETVVHGDTKQQHRRFHCITAPVPEEAMHGAPSTNSFLTPHPLRASDGDADSHAETESTTSFEQEIEEICTPIKDDKSEDYLLMHCNIRAADLKVNALARIRELRSLLCDLEQANVIRLAHDCANGNAAGSTANFASIFGFSKMYVDEVATFNDRVITMITTDTYRCWHANGRRNLKQPTYTVYELLRQLGIHPVKGTNATHWGAPEARARDFMSYSEYAFDMARLKRNCSRLKIGVIGNRRT